MPSVVNIGRSLTSNRYATDDEGWLAPCSAPDLGRIEAVP